MNKSRLHQLENALRGVVIGTRCPQCHCIGGDGRTGAAILHTPGAGPVPTEEQRTCQACGAIRLLVRITTPLSRGLEERQRRDPSLTYDAYLADQERGAEQEQPS